MSQLKCFSIVGDSNVKRNMVSSNTKGRSPMSDAQVLHCGRLSLLSTCLEKVRADADACVLACISNFISGSIPAMESSVMSRVDSIITSFFEKAVSFSHNHPATFVFVLAPMYRTKPIWYRDSLSAIVQKFGEGYAGLEDRPHNLLLLPSFSRVQLEADGVHLSPYSGMEFVLHLFDAAQEVRSNLELPCENRVLKTEVVCVGLQDRVHVLEQDHSRLSHKFELQMAANSEALDLQENVRNETYLMMQGLPRLPKMDSKMWHTRALADVNKIFTSMGFDPVAKFIQNSTGRSNDARVLYKVKVESPELSKAIRDKFASFFSGGQDSRPDFLSGLSIRNCVTPATLGRIAILQLLGRRYKDSNVGSRFQVISYEPRPLLKLTPPPGASDKRVMTFNFIEAISKLPTNFDQDEIDGLLKRISPRLHGQLQSLFVVISDDMIKNKSRSGPKEHPRPAAEKSPGSSSDSSFKTPTGSGSRKRGRAATSSGPAAKK